MRKKFLPERRSVRGYCRETAISRKIQPGFFKNLKLFAICGFAGGCNGKGIATAKRYGLICHGEPTPGYMLSALRVCSRDSLSI